METNRPKVGVGVIIRKEGRVLLGKRKNSHGSGTWSLPGGHLEFGESWEDCAETEVAEETGLTVCNLGFGALTNDIFLAEGKHYITIFMVSDYGNGEPQILEPEKCEGWSWFEWNRLPSPLFIPLQNLVAQGYSPFAS